MTPKTKTKANDAETAVRLYLLLLDDPAQLRDEDDILAKTTAVLNAIDPIDKLKALAALDAASNIDEAPIRDGFVKYAKSWADDLRIPVAALREMGVPDEVLRAAGFALPAPPRRPASASRAKAVPVDTIKAHILTMKGEFLLADIIKSIGGSQATVRKAIGELIDDGKVKNLGAVTDWQERGRAPNRYSVVT